MQRKKEKEKDMSDQRSGGIAWTEETWNPTRGCSRVSKGCEHCYAEQVARRFSGAGEPYHGLVRLDAKGKAKAQWNGNVLFVEEHLLDPIRWKRPRMIFVNSMSDVFHEGFSITQIARIFAVMAASPHHVFQVLTKRASRMSDMLKTDWFWHEVFTEFLRVSIQTHVPSISDSVVIQCNEKALRNVWIGVSVEDQITADERIPHLLNAPARVRWVSYEPAIGPVDLLQAAFNGAESFSAMGRLDWIVVGGESGPGARRFETQWARGVIEQCAQSGTACFVKQLGAWAEDEHGEEIHLKDRKGGKMAEWPADLRVREWPAAYPGAIVIEKVAR